MAVNFDSMMKENDSFGILGKEMLIDSKYR